MHLESIYQQIKCYLRTVEKPKFQMIKLKSTGLLIITSTSKQTVIGIIMAKSNKPIFPSY